METSKEKKERLEIRRELKPVLEKIMFNEELKSVLEKIKPHNYLIIDRAPLVEISGYHAKEINQIEWIRKYMVEHGQLIIKTLSPSPAIFSHYAATVADVACTNIDVALSALGQKLSKCSRTCTCGEPVDLV